PPRRAREAGSGGPGPATRGPPPERRIVDQRQVDRIGQGDRRAGPGRVAVTAGAALAVEGREVEHRRRPSWTIGAVGPAGEAVTGGGDGHDQTRREDAPGHRSSGAPTPARTANGECWKVATRTERATTRPATSPNAICVATNHPHSMRASRAGLMTSSTDAMRPVHMSGATTPPQNAGCHGNIG